MKFRSVAILAIIGLLISTGTVSAISGLSINQVNWNPVGSHIRGQGGQYILIYFNNQDGYSKTVPITLQLSVPGWYTRHFQQTFSIPGFANRYAVSMGFILDKSWPAGNYNAKVLAPDLITSQFTGVISVI